MTTPERDHQHLTDLVTSLTARAAASRPGDDGVEGSIGAVAAIDRSEHPAVASSGVTASFGADGSPLDPSSPTISTVGPHTVFDMASVTKVVTTLTAATLISDGTLDPQAPLTEHIPSPHRALTAHHLLTHTSGLPPVMPLWQLPGGREERLASVHAAALEAEPGTRHAYSCIGFILLGRLLEALTGHTLPSLARSRVLGPAGADSAVWAEAPGAPIEAVAASAAGTTPLIAATEYQTQPDRGLVRGSTHDETAWSIGGVGNAGLFATVADALAIGRVLAGRTALPSLAAEALEMLRTDQLDPAVTTGAPWRQGLGLRIGQETAPGASLEHVVGHPGFTGTSVLADPRTGTVAVLLTNRVHPVRTRFTVEKSRRDIARLAFTSG